MPHTLYDLLSNSLILQQTAPYIPVSGLLALASASKSFKSLIHNSREAFRYLDLTTVKVVSVSESSAPIDVGGVSWRSQRMDEGLTEDEFYCGPIRGIFSNLERRGVLQHVRTLILDGLSVPAELVNQIVSEDRFRVHILSIREVKNLNERKLQQVLLHAVRDSRPVGALKLKGLYFFGPKPHRSSNAPAKAAARPSAVQSPTGVTSSEGAQIGAEWNQRSSTALSSSLVRTQDEWYQPAGRIFPRSFSPEWATTLQACSGKIAFNAVLCRGPRHNPESPSWLRPAIATIALGPTGCGGCGTCPESPALFHGPSWSTQHFPLLDPIPIHSYTLDAARTPATPRLSSPPPLIVRCEDCLRGRWCERCNKWWCESCYQEPVSRFQPTEMQQIEDMAQHGWAERGLGTKLKMGVHRDCFGCGRTCEHCKEIYIRRCKSCQQEYCIVDNEGSSDTTCDWCNHSGRRTRELY
ncbi:hypothetical protein BJ546DRAFT_1025615 [Cryomyces antarcticus]